MTCEEFLLLLGALALFVFSAVLYMNGEDFILCIAIALVVLGGIYVVLWSHEGDIRKLKEKVGDKQ